jgi:hypothetical protein
MILYMQRKRPIHNNSFSQKALIFSNLLIMVKYEYFKKY